MENKPPRSGSFLISAGLALILVVLTLSTIYIFEKRIWWFPTAISPLGQEIDQQFMRTLIICGIVFFFAQLGLGYVVLRYRDHGQPAHYYHGSNFLEAVWTIATAVMFLGLGIAATRGWSASRLLLPSPTAVKVEVTAQQFAWNFRYPGPDGIFGRTDPKLVSDERGNPLGLDTTDPAAKDDVVTATMAVPVNREVEVILRSKDVTHSFFVRELRFKQDAVPGMLIRLRFVANQVGRYEIACAELCGLGHSNMRAFLEVMPEAEFENWLRQQAATQ